MGLFSGGNSSSTNTTQNPDARVSTEGGDFKGASAAGNDNRTTSVGQGALSTVADVSGTGNTLQILDAGAVSKSLELAMRGIEQANALASTTVARSGDLVAGIFDAQSDTNRALAQGINDTKAPDVRVLAFGALAVVGVVAAMAFKKG